MSHNNKKKNKNISPVWVRALKPNQEFEKKEIMDVVYVEKQILGIIFGFILGAIPVTGIAGIIIFLGLTSGITLVYLSKFIKIDESKFEKSDLITEGLFPGFGVFMVCWILSFNIFNPDHLIN
eukprot:TRINITY_DN5778_c0_g3_i1.p1 TRINITY_DN5778_c0_g3~~TRINITY_DN5778_c0_g3_i1.p1  ORF type:complete len:123 (+),score=31.09 TRINITY_DN5778_c0_g3_i1:65-433(+)